MKRISTTSPLIFSSSSHAYQFHARQMSISFAPEVTFPNANGNTNRPTILSRITSHPDPVSTAKAKLPRPKLRAVSTGNILCLARRESKVNEETPETRPRNQENGASGTLPPLTSKITVPGPRYEQSPKPAYKPDTGIDEECVYVLTLKTSPEINEPINRLRTEHFPVHLNKTPAHLTIFHALPHSRRDVIEKNLDMLTAHTKPFLIAAGQPFRMRQGVGIALEVGVKEAQTMHEELRGLWVQWLSEQDRGGWMPHWTVMNKVGNEGKVKEAFEGMKKMLYEEEIDGRAVGLELWRYGKEGWVWVKEFGFRGTGRRTGGRIVKPAVQRGDGVVGKGKVRKGLKEDYGN